MRVYAIGDVHGQLGLLQQAHRLIADDGGAQARVVHLGDLIDRGPESRGVIDHLIAGQAAGRDWHVVMGNHDRLLWRFLDDPDWIDPGLKRPLSWAVHPDLGAAPTIRSYGVDPDQPAAAIYAALMASAAGAHRDWLAGLARWHLVPGVLFVHAGIRPGVDLQAQTEQDCLWICGDFLDSDADHGPLVVHGHTPVEAPDLRANRLNIDTGAAWGRALCPVVIEDGHVWQLTEAGRRALGRVGQGAGA